MVCRVDPRSVSRVIGPGLGRNQFAVVFASEEIK